MNTATVQQPVPLRRLFTYSDVIVSGAAILIVLMMIVPMPTVLLDALLALNISIALTVLLVTMYTQEALQFSVFPSLLLVLTLFRLALNISATRAILLNGYAGHVIDAFGNFVVGGNYAVGFVVFLILVIIQFVVITNGAGRVAEVAARFTLDAMPGKQMSIDSDLNAGLITEEEARERRQKVAREADFYGAMDGASKFVRGDAIAAIVIMLVNIIGGFIVGMAQQGLSLLEALQRYTLLTVGEGLVAQIPALLISTATGIIVTRAAATSALGQDAVRQLLAQPRVLNIVAGALVVVGLLPGLPKVPFFLLAAGAFLLARLLQQNLRAQEVAQQPSKAVQRPPENVSELLAVDRMGLEIGYALIPLVDVQQNGDLLERVTLMRRQIALDLGIIVPPIRIRDNMQLPANTYSIKLKGVEIARGEVLPRYYLAMNPGSVRETIEGIPTKEPAFGLPALWIEESLRRRAEAAGYTVVDATSVVITHLQEVIKAHAADILTRQDVQALVDNLRQTQSAVVEELIPTLLSLGEVQRVLSNLLRERVPIRDLGTILEALADGARVTKDIDQLTELVRRALARLLCQRYRSSDGSIYVTTLDPNVEQTLLEA
ncbi:MAG: flagellar biosynthesis protein FlhA, partial [Abditibacteriales bacterium]|nr:flagellar biosynthesis protein FlhA [Abditibacteriales bacterium]